MARFTHIDGHRTEALREGWEILSVAPGAAETPGDLAAFKGPWRPARVPGTVASALRAAGTWDLAMPRRFDAVDWWWRTRFAAPRGGEDAEGARAILRFEGLATVAHVFLNGERILCSDSMFHEHEVDVTGALGAENDLVIRFCSLDALLAAKRPRPRWKTRLVEHQQLRFWRTTLLGRMPGWCPEVAAVGPWRAISLERRARFTLSRANLRAHLDGDDGVVDADLELACSGGAQPTSAMLIVGGLEAPLAVGGSVAGKASCAVIQGSARIARAERWWPHTHGEPRRYDARVLVRWSDGADTALVAGKVGFRSIALRTEPDDDFAILVNDVPVFCRGACWTTTDVVTLDGTPAAYDAALDLARRAGMNMIRIGGTTFYESDELYARCDALGILVWQDLQFASMDYPADDPAFVASTEREAFDLLNRLQARPSLALLCGNSEVEQQAAMLGLPRALWRSPLFAEALPRIARALRPDVPCCPSSPFGGALPFQPDSGLAHYYGVGAYLRPLDDARRAGVRFASECLAFANVPARATIDALLGAGEAAPHHPAWKARVPRDPGVGWDFDDVRDHYVSVLFGVDPARIRRADGERYLALGRVATGEAMAHTFAEWRRRRSSCHGGLVWTFQDLWAGAGWGVVDATGRPKAAYYYLARAFRPVTAFFTDEGTGGLRVHAVNDGAGAVEASLRVTLYRNGQLPIATAERAVELPPRDVVEVSVDGLLDGFLDTTHAYRFGPPGHDLVIATLRREGSVVSDAAYFPLGLPADRERDLGLSARARAAPGESGEWVLTLESRRVAVAVAIEAEGFLPEDDYLHLPPGEERRVRLRPRIPGAARPSGFVEALNGRCPARIDIEE